MKYKNLQKQGIRPSNQSPFMAVADVYLNMGYSVIPLAKNDKRPIIASWSERCEQLPTPDEAKGWFHDFRDNNVGLATGKASGVIAVDIDTEDGELLKKIENKLPPSPVKKRGKKAYTAFYKYSGQKARKFRLSTNENVLEILSGGNQTVLPPSIHPETNLPYEWITEATLLTINKTELPELPEEMISEIEAIIREHGPGNPEQSTKEVDCVEISESRNNALKEYAIELIKNCEPTDSAVKSLLDRDVEHKTPLFADKSEGNAKLDPWTNAQRFYTSILQSMNQKRLAEGLEPYNPKAAPLRTEKQQACPNPLGSAAFHGLAGAIIKTISPHTESDEAALLGQLLIAFGNIIGRGPHFKVEATEHYTNLFGLIVGETARARKGTGLNYIKNFLSAVDEVWERARITHGLSSGEGLIHAVRDSTTEVTTSQNDEGEMVENINVVDAGVADKRLLVIQTEFGALLKVASRPDNLLSAHVRVAWDGETLETLTKHSPEKATNPHISIIGHITKEELLKLLNQTDIANGFGNRFLVFFSKRSKLLPEGGQIPSNEVAALKNQLGISIKYAMSVGRVDFSPEARSKWHTVYSQFGSGINGGLLQAMTARAEPQVLRLATVYALLDKNKTISVPHLEAALEVWRYCEDSCRFLFGDTLGDGMADEIYRQLKMSPAGLTRTAIRDLFSRNLDRGQIDRVLRLLENTGRAYKHVTHSGGRPLETWYARNTQ